MDALHVTPQELTALAESMLKEGKSVDIPTRGYSMRPMLRFDGSFVRLAPPETLRCGDVALYRYPDGTCVLHRIVSVRGDELICRGDGNLWTEHVKPEWVIGVVTNFNRSGKWVSVNAAGYRLYRFLWMKLWFLRKYAMPLWQRLKR